MRTVKGSLKKPLLYSISLLFILWMLFNTFSCSCGNKPAKPAIQENPPSPPSGNIKTDPSKPPHLKLAALKTSIRGSEPIQVDMRNEGEVPITDAQLQVIRIEGTDASLDGMLPVDSVNNKYAIPLDLINAKGSITKKLNIRPGTDSKAAFEFCVIRQGKKMGNSFTITWEKEGEVKIEDIKYDEKTGDISCSLANRGAKELYQVKIQVISKTPGIRLNGKAIKEGTIKEPFITDQLYPGEEKANIYLGKLDFGINPKADFEFKVVYEGGATEFVKYTFIPAKTELTAEITYHASKKEVTCNIKNIGKHTASDVQLFYENISSMYSSEKRVTLNGITSGSTAGVDVAAGEEIKVTLSVDFKGEEEATFKFEIRCGGVILKHLTKEIKLQAPPIELRLLPIGYSSADAAETIKLKGDNKKVKFKILPQPADAIIKEKYVGLKISRIDGKEGFISASEKKAAPIQEIPASNLVSKLSKEVELYICPQKDKKLTFKIQPWYKSREAGKSLTVDWEAEEEVQLQLMGKEGVPDFGGKLAKFDVDRVELNENEKNSCFTCKIEKLAGGTIDVADIVVKIERKQGTSAFLSTSETGSEITKLSGSEITKLLGVEQGSIAGKNITLYVHPETDEQCAFSLMLYYKGKPQGTPLSIKWEAKKVRLRLEVVDPKPAPGVGGPIELDDDKRYIKFKIIQEEASGEVRDLNQLRLAIERKSGNTAYLAASENGLEVSELSDSQLGKIGEDIILYVYPGKETKFEYQLQLFYRGERQGVPLQFSFSWEVKPVQLKFKVIDPPIFEESRVIDLVGEDVMKLSITAGIESGQVDLSKVKLTFNNRTKESKAFLSLSRAGGQVTELEGDQLGKIGEELTFYINNARPGETCEFEYQLYYKDQPIGDMLVVKYKAKEASLELVMLDHKPKKGMEQFIQLPQGTELVRFKVIQEEGSGEVNLDDIRLTIERTIGSTAFLSASSHGGELTELTKGQLPQLDKEVALYLHPGTDDQYEFKLQLYYQGQRQHIPLRLSWQRIRLHIEDANTVVGNSKGSFSLRWLSPLEVVDPEQVIIQLESNNEAEFVLLDKYGQEAGNVATLANLGYTPSVFNMLGFKLKNANSETEADVTIKVVQKQGEVNQLLAEETVAWEEQGINLQVILQRGNLDTGTNKWNYTTETSLRSISGEPILIQVASQTEDKVLASNITFQLSNPEGVNIKLMKLKNGKVISVDESSNSNIEYNLASLVEEAELKKGGSLFVLQVIGAPSGVYSASLEIAFKEDGGKVFYRRKLSWLDPRIKLAYNKCKTDVSTKLQYASLNTAIREYYGAPSIASKNNHLKQVISLLNDAEQIRKEVEQLEAIVTSSAFDALAGETYNKHSFRTDLLIPTEDIIEKSVEFLSPVMQSVPTQVQGLLENQRFEEAIPMLGIMEMVCNSKWFVIPGKEQLIDDACEQFVYKLAKETQHYAEEKDKFITDQLRSISSSLTATRMAESTEKIIVEKIDQEKTELDKAIFQEIAKQAYDIALNILESKIKCDLASAALMLKESEIWQEISKKYELEDKIRRVTQAAYDSIGQSYYTAVNKAKQEISIITDGNLKLTKAKGVFELANEATKVAIQAGNNGFGGDELKPAIQSAYEVAAKVYSEMAIKAKEEVNNQKRNTELMLKKAKEAFDSASKAAEVASQANGKGFKSVKLHEVVQSAYDAAVESYYKVANQAKREIYTSDGQQKENKVKEALNAANKAVNIAIKAKEEGFRGGKLHQISQLAYWATAEIYLAMANKAKEEASLSLKDEPAAEALDAANKAAEVAIQAKKNDFTFSKLNEVVQSTYKVAAEAYLAIANKAKEEASLSFKDESKLAKAAEALDAANKAAEVVIQGESRGFKSGDVVQLVQKAYIVAAEIELAIAKEKEALIGYTRASRDRRELAVEAWIAAGRAEKVAEAAKKAGEFVSETLKQKVIEAYKAANQAYMSLGDLITYTEAIQEISQKIQDLTKPVET